MLSTVALRVSEHSSDLKQLLTQIPTANNLPESAYILVNHRIAIDHSVHSVKDHYSKLLYPSAERWNFTLCEFDVNCKVGEASGAICLSSHESLEPSPVSDSNDPRFGWLSGTLRGVFGKDVIVAPVLLSGIALRSFP